jgi:1-aminocyclopropane-1-carboxylate deaminase
MTQEIILENNKDVSLYIKREDLLHPIISGNKFRKLKYNLEEAKKKGFKKLLTFGGAFSNHILAVAAAGKEFGFETTGIIRGDELRDKIAENPTLMQAQELGMHFIFVTREEYRYKEEETQLEKWGILTESFYIIPEGGTNDLAIKGCEEILTKEDEIYTHICCSIGTGGTISGIINSATENQKIIGFSSLKGEFMSSQISNFVTKTNWEVNTDYHFGGYGKVNEELISFLNNFYKKTTIPLDPIYTGKMVFGILDLIEKKYFKKGSKILLIHTGGLQGIRGMNQLLIKKNKEIINYVI